MELNRDANNRNLTTHRILQVKLSYINAGMWYSFVAALLLLFHIMLRVVALLFHAVALCVCVCVCSCLCEIHMVAFHQLMVQCGTWNNRVNLA
jgi:hypothetical protein